MWELLVFLPFVITPGKLKTYMVKKRTRDIFLPKEVINYMKNLETLDYAEVYMRCAMIESFINARTCTPSVSCILQR